MDDARTQVEQFYESYIGCCNDRRFDELSAYVADDVVIDGERVGLVDYLDGLRNLVEAFADYRWRVDRLVVEPPWLAVHLFVSGTHTGERWGLAATGRTIASQEFAFYRLAEGKIAEVWDTADDLDIVGQLGG